MPSAIVSLQTIDQLLQVQAGRNEELDEDEQRMLFFRRGAAAISLQARRTVDPSGESEEAETGTMGGEVESTTGDVGDERVLRLLKRKSYLLYRLQKMKCKQAKEHNARKASHISLTALARYSTSRQELRASNMQLQLVPRPACTGESSGSIGAHGVTASSSIAAGETGALTPLGQGASRAGSSHSNKGSQPTLDLDDEEER